MKQIFEPVKMSHIELRNRLIRSATWEGIANPDGGIAEGFYEIYQELAEGGVGGIITGFTSVALHDYYIGGMMRLCDDALIPQYKKLTDSRTGSSQQDEGRSGGHLKMRLLQCLLLLTGAQMHIQKA